jgi:poly-D-alanine transfer protein DltD
MNLNKQQLNAIALDLFNKLEIAKNVEMERVTPILLKDKKLLAIKKIDDQLKELNNQVDSLTLKKIKLAKDLGVISYVRNYETIKDEFLRQYKKSLKSYTLDDIKNLIVLASIEETDLSALMNAVIKKIDNTNE